MNDYDWLGSGVYFWEANPLRGLEFAQEVQARRAGKPGQIQNPYVVGAIVELGYCLDMLSSTGVDAVRSAHDDFLIYCDAAGIDLPINKGGTDLLLRGLDCAVINHLHKVRDEGDLPPFDTVRGVFLEGGRIYQESGFFEKTHIQICVCNLDCIKGVFRVPDDHLIAS